MKLSWWEEMIMASAVSFLMMLKTKVTNKVELAAIQAAIDLLQRLLSGTFAMHG
jgi:hypothetical protein